MCAGRVGRTQRESAHWDSTIVVADGDGRGGRASLMFMRQMNLNRHDRIMLVATESQVSNTRDTRLC